MKRYNDIPWETKPKPMTNADRIRGMTDEELAEFLMHFALANIAPTSLLIGEFPEGEKERILKLLQEPAEGD